MFLTLIGCEPTLGNWSPEDFAQSQLAVDTLQRELDPEASTHGHSLPRAYGHPFQGLYRSYRQAFFIALA